MSPARRLAAYITPHWRRLLAAMVCAGSVAFLTAGFAYMVKPIIDEIFINKKFELLKWIVPGVVVIGISRGGFNYGRSYLMRWVGNRAIADLRNDLYRKMIKMPIGFFSHQRTGKLISLVVNDAAVVQQVVATVIRDLFQQSLTMFVLMGVLFYLNWKLAIVSVIIIPLGAYPLSVMGKKIRKVARLGQEKVSDLTTHLDETLSGIRLIKSFGAEKYEIGRFMEINKAYFRKLIKTTRISEIVPWVMESAGALAAAFILGVGANEVREGRMTPGEFFSFLGASWMMYAPVRHLAATSTVIQQALAAIDRIFWLMDEPNEQVEDRGKKHLKKLRTEIHFENLSFRYEGAKEGALRGINLKVNAGEMIALVGSSGSGKTTLMNLLLRFYDPTEGAIRIDGEPVREFSLSSLREKIGMVAQETILFDDTVARNIAYGQDLFDMERVRNAARAAYADDFISRLSEGYETKIGESGVRLSGGQRQRLAIARAIFRDAPILILDEATSSLDSESEMYIQKALTNLMKNRTTFVIAHRLSTVKNARRIVVLSRGRIAEVGTHQELLKMNGIYQKLYRLQFRDEYEEALEQNG